MRRWAASLGVNRSTLAVLIVVGGLGLSEELWRNFLAIYLNVRTGDVARAVGYMGVYATLLATQQPWAIVAGASVDPNRRTIAFAVQSIQKRLPKVLGPLIGGLVCAAGYLLNLTLAVAILAGAMVAQAVPLGEVLRRIPPELKQLLSAEILLRWGDWFVRDFAAVYVVAILGRSAADYGLLASLTAFTALATYLLFSSFPFALVLLPKTGMPVMAALILAFVVNGLREVGEPARKATIAAGMPPEIRTRAVTGYHFSLSLGASHFSLAFIISSQVTSACL